MKRVAVLALLALAACSSDPAPRRAAPPASPAPATSAAAPSPSTVPSASAAGVLALTVLRDSGGLELYRLDRRTRVATLDRVLAPPQEGAEVLDAAVTRSQLCATWHVGEGELHDDPRTALVCYQTGSSQGRAVTGAEQPVELALTPDGGRVAWAQFSPGENQVVATARLRAGVLSEQRRFLSRADQPETGERAFTGTAVQHLAWIDDGELALSTLVESDDGPDLLRFDVAAPGDRGWLDEGVRVPVPDEDYLTYDSAVPLDRSTALAVERGSYMDDDPPPSRAVRIDLRTGRVLQVLATAAEGRDVIGVSGSLDAVVYLTAGGRPGSAKTYLRLAGEARGTPVSGLPSDVVQALVPG